MKWMMVVFISGGLFGVQAALIVQDSFDYSLGTVSGTMLSGAGDGWFTGWYFYNGVAGEIVPGLNFSGVRSSGNALKLSNSTGATTQLFRGMDRDLASGTYYMSMIFKRTDADNGVSGENWHWTLRSGNVTNAVTAGWRLEAGSTSGETENLKVYTTEGAVTDMSAETYAVNSPVLMLVKIVVDQAEGAAETVSVIMYDLGEPLPADDSSIEWPVSITGEWTSELSKGWGLLVTPGIEEMTIDEFKLGTELSDIIPQPATFSLLGSSKDR